MADGQGNGWSEWQQKVLGDIGDLKEEARRQADRRDQQIERLTQKVSNLEAEVKALRTIAGFAGGIAGILGGGLMTLISKFK